MLHELIVIQKDQIKDIEKTDGALNLNEWRLREKNDTAKKIAIKLKQDFYRDPSKFMNDICSI
jgi:hypothetical protein